MTQNKKIITLIITVLLLSSCSYIIVPSKQKNIVVHTDNPESKVYVDKKLAGTGSDVALPKIEKDGFKQITIKTPHRTIRYAMAPEKRNPFWYVALPFDIALLPTGLGFYIFSPLPKFRNYDTSHEFKEQYTVPRQKEGERDIRYVATRMKISNYDKDFNSYYVKYSKNLQEEFMKAENDAYQRELKEKQRKKKKGESDETLDDGKKINFNDTYFSKEIYETLKKSGYIDTTGTLLKDKSKILGIESIITRGKIYNITSKSSYQKNLVMLKLDINWRFLNSYDQIVDSIQITEFSDQFVFPKWYSNTSDRDEDFSILFQSAVNNSFLSLYETNLFADNITKKITPASYPALTISSPKTTVKNTKDALMASVIIERKNNKGHGSGFAISQDGYILTNYHVIAGKKEGENAEFTVVMPDGSKKDAQVIRVDLIHDIALLKVDGIFEKAFTLNNEKNYSILDDIYTVGAPVSVQLGNTVSRGVLSNERQIEDIKLLQLNIAISPGNSGGPIFSTETGELFGVVSSKISGQNVEGIGFAIPSYMINKYLNITVKQ